MPNNVSSSQITTPSLYNVYLHIDLLFSLMTFCDMTAGIVIGRGTTDGHCALVERDC